MSKFRIVTPEECKMSYQEQIELIAAINDVLTSGLRIYGIQRAQLEFVQEVASVSGWSVTPLHFDGESVDVVFSVCAKEDGDPRKKAWQYRAA